MGVYKRKDSGQWAVSWTDENGDRHRKTIGTRTDAEAFLKRITGPSRCDILLRQYATSIIQSASISRPPNTVKSYENSMVMLKDMLSFRLDEVTLERVREHQMKRMEDGVKPGTINREVMFLSMVLSHAVEDGLIKVNPLRGRQRARVRLPEGQGSIRYLTMAELRRLLEACQEPLKSIVTVAAYTGMRMDEIFQMTWARTTRTHAQVWRKHKRDYSPVPLCKEAWMAIAQQKRTSTFVFPGRKGDKRTSCRTAFNAAAERAELSDISFHTLRHTFASHAIMDGMDIRTLQEILGHSKLDMVMRYAHLADDHKAKQVERLGRRLSQAGGPTVTESVTGSSHVHGGKSRK